MEQSSALAAYAIDSQGTRSGGEAKTAVFTDEEIEWFDLNTRELRFGIDSEAIHKRLESLDRMEFRLGDDVLFQVDNLINPTFSRWIWRKRNPFQYGRSQSVNSFRLMKKKKASTEIRKDSIQNGVSVFSWGNCSFLTGKLEFPRRETMKAHCVAGRR